MLINSYVSILLMQEILINAFEKESLDFSSARAAGRCCSLTESVRRQPAPQFDQCGLGKRGSVLPVTHCIRSS